MVLETGDTGTGHSIAAALSQWCCAHHAGVLVPIVCLSKTCMTPPGGARPQSALLHRPPSGALSHTPS